MLRVKEIVIPSPGMDGNLPGYVIQVFSPEIIYIKVTRNGLSGCIYIFRGVCVGVCGCNNNKAEEMGYDFKRRQEGKGEGRYIRMKRKRKERTDVIIF